MKYVLNIILHYTLLHYILARTYSQKETFNDI